MVPIFIKLSSIIMRYIFNIFFVPIMFIINNLTVTTIALYKSTCVTCPSDMRNILLLGMRDPLLLPLYSSSTAWNSFHRLVLPMLAVTCCTQLLACFRLSFVRFCEYGNSSSQPLPNFIMLKRQLLGRWCNARSRT